MAKNYYIPAGDPEKGIWLDNLAAKLPTYAGILDLPPADVTGVQADSLFFAFVLEAHNQHTLTTQNWTAYKKALRSGSALGPLPTTPALGTPPPAVPPNVFGRAAALAMRIKAHPAYTEAIGADLGLIGADRIIDFGTLKPILKITFEAGRPNIGWTKQGMDGLEIHVDRGTGSFAFLTFDTVPDYRDTAPLPAPGAGAVWKYKAIYRLADEQAGQWSDTANISVMG